MNLRKLTSLAHLIVILAVAICFPLFIRNPYVLTIMIPGLIWGIPCMGWTTIVRTGQFSLGQAGFLAIGAYTSALSMINYQLSFWLSLLLGGIISAFIALLLGMVVLRLGGIYFCIVTLAFCEILRVIAMNLTNVTNGVYGLIPPPPSLHLGRYSIDFVTGKVPHYYLALFLVIIAAIVFWRMDRSLLGRVFRSISSNSTLSEHLGMRLMKYRVIAFTVAAFFTGMAGAVFSSYLSFIGPTLFALSESIMILIMCTAGGIGSSVVGPIIGALVLSASGDYLTGLVQGSKPLVFGSLVVIIVFLLPSGLVDLGRKVLKVFSSLRRNY